MVQVQEFTIADLRKRLESGSWFEGDPIPLTRERALSHINNPRADDSDVALLVAYDDEMVIAHLGILPDHVFVGEQGHKIGWLTAWWANPDRKYSGSGIMLMMRALSRYKNGVGASGFSEDAKAIYIATKCFKTIKELPGLSAFARFDLTHMLPKRLPPLAHFWPLLQCADAMANLFVRLRQYLWRRVNPLPVGFRLEYVPELDAEAGQFIERHPQNGLARRGAREINWIARYSWMTCTPLNSPPAFRFETTAQSRRSYHLMIRDASCRLVAVVLLHIIDNHLIIPCCCHDNQAALVARIIGHHLIELRLKRITTFRTDLIEQFGQSRFPWVIQKQCARSWILAGQAAVVGTKPVGVQDGDGDCAFTL